MEIELVVFDMAGTTVKDNNDVSHFLQRSMLKAGVDVTLSEINKVMGYPKPLAIKMLLDRHLQGTQVVGSLMVNEIHEDFVSGMIDYYKNNPNVEEKDGVSKVFGLLRNNGIKIAIDTGFDRTIANTILERMNWGDLVDACVTSDEVKKGRPHPDMIFKAMELTGVTEALKVAKVGDTASDIQQGKLAGCKYVIGVTTGAYKAEDLKKENPTHLIENLLELFKILNLKILVY